MSPAADTPPPPLHELEAEVMDGVWNSGHEDVTVREMMDVLNARTRIRAHTRPI